MICDNHKSALFLKNNNQPQNEEGDKMANNRGTNMNCWTYYILLISQSLHLIIARNFGPQVDPGKNIE